MLPKASRPGSGLSHHVGLAWLCRQRYGSPSPRPSPPGRGRHFFSIVIAVKTLKSIGQIQSQRILPIILRIPARTFPDEPIRERGGEFAHDLSGQQDLGPVTLVTFSEKNCERTRR